MFINGMALVFIGNNESYAYSEKSDGGNRTAKFLVTTDIGLIPCAAKHSYFNTEEYYINSDEVVIKTSIMGSYYTDWTGWVLLDLNNSTINKVNFYNSNDKYVGTSDLLDKVYQMILPGDAEGISTRQNNKEVRIKPYSAKAKTTFSLKCDDAVNPISSVNTSITMK
ncbi:hypothetical protein [Tissierella praeacuta]|uniref:hypothetical protein n=1 Tax=Tissierella praeacuta TaxID=43131 RepID=UPI00333F4897